MEWYGVGVGMPAHAVGHMTEQSLEAKELDRFRVYNSGSEPACSAQMGVGPSFLSYWTVSQPALCFGENVDSVFQGCWVHKLL